MRSFIVSAQFVLLILLSCSLYAQPCGLQGDGTNGSVASCQNSPTTITYTIPPNCGCQPGATFFSWQISGIPSVIVDQSTVLPVSVTNGSLTGTVTAATSTSITIKWDCAPCPNGQPYHLFELLPSCGDFANPIIRIECLDTIPPPPPPCQVLVSEVCCLKFDFAGGGDRCCACVRIVFEDGTVLYDIISVGPDNSATLCYEKPIKSYTVTKIACKEWCATSPPGDDPKTKVQFENGGHDLSNFSVYPNPSADKKVRVQFEAETSGPLYFEIIDMSGKVLKSQQIESRKGFNEWLVNCEVCNSAQPYTFVVLDKGMKVLENKIILLNH